jgi:hypothetical protein
LFRSATKPPGPGDRILFLYLPAAELLDELSGSVPGGIIVCIGTRDEVYDGRKSVTHLENVMLTAATMDEIPWRDGFFNWIIGPAMDENTTAGREIRRVLASGGEWLTDIS